MFLYCGNNPVNRTDSNGDLFQRLDFNTCGGGGGGIIVAAAIYYGVSAFATAISSIGAIPQETWYQPDLDARTASWEKEWEKEEDIVTSNSDSNPSYWKASLSGGTVVIGEPLSLQKACLWVSQGNNLMCKNQEAAIEILLINGYRNYVGPEKGCGNNFYSHYHPTRNHTGSSSIHIWFYE